MCKCANVQMCKCANAGKSPTNLPAGRLGQKNTNLTKGSLKILKANYTVRYAQRKILCSWCLWTLVKTRFIQRVQCQGIRRNWIRTQFTYIFALRFKQTKIFLFAAGHQKKDHCKQSY